jgi:hypothetical protein
VNVWLPPTMILTLLGETVRFSSAAAFTVSVWVALL